MASNQRLNATITIGSAMQSSVGKNIGFIRQGMSDIGSEIRGVTKRQKELSKQRKTLIKQGKSVDELDAEYEQLNQTLADLTKSQKRWENAAKSSRKVGSSFSKMTGDIGSLSRKAAYAIGGASAAVFGLANSTASLGDDVAKTSDKLGIQIGTFQELRYAAERSGVGTAKFDSSMVAFTKRLGEAAQGTGAAKKALDEMGLSAEALESMTPDEALAVVSDRMKSVESQTRKVAYASALFSRQGVDMVNMMKDGSEGMQKLQKDARDTGYVLSDEAARDSEAFKDAMLDAQLGMAGLKNTIGSALMPVVTDMMKSFKGWMGENRDLVMDFSKRLATGLRDAVPAIGALASGLATVGSALGSAVSATASLVGGFDNLGMVIGAVFAGKAAISIAGFVSSVWGLGSAMVSLAGGAIPLVVAGVKAIGLALAANPIGAIVTGIALAAGAVIAYWEPIKGFFSGLWDTVSSAFDGGWETIKSVLSWSPLGMLMKAWKPMLDWVTDKIGWIGDAAKSVGEFFGIGGSEDAPEKENDGEDSSKRAESQVGSTQTREAGNSQASIEPPAQPEVGDAVGRARYVAEGPEPPSAETVNGKVRYDVEPPAQPEVDSIARSFQPRLQAKSEQRPVSITNEWNITIHQQPGQDPQDLIDEIEQRQKERESAAMYDGAMAYGY